MITLIIILRIIHFFSGIFWVGFSIFNIHFLQPAVKATGVEGQVVMQHLVRKTRLLSVVYWAASLTMVSGLVLYWAISRGSIAFFGSTYGMVLGTGALAGILAWISALFLIRNIMNRLQAISGQMRASEGPPEVGLMEEMQAHAKRLGTVGKITLALQTLAILTMAMARYM